MLSKSKLFPNYCFRNVISKKINRKELSQEKKKKKKHKTAQFEEEFLKNYNNPGYKNYIVISCYLRYGNNKVKFYVRFNFKVVFKLDELLNIS